MSTKKYPENKNVDLSTIGSQVLNYWNQNNIFEKSIATREGSPAFTFFEGPPSANGTPGIHHVMARTVKDIFCRYKTLKGFQVKRKGGWDTHGLPVELQVEKELGITKEDIGTKITVEEYNKKCRETVMRFKSEWDDLTQKMGYWVDLNDPYITFDSKYIETCWYLLKELYKKDLLYKGYTIQPYSPAAGTGLSSHELNQPGCYRDVKDTSVVAQFKVTDTTKAALQKISSETINSDAYFLAWTTTPWTLPSNAALAVGENIDYVVVKSFNAYTFEPITVVLAKALVGKYFNEKGKDADFAAFKSGDKVLPWTILGECKGKQLVGLEYHQLLPYVPAKGPAFRVIPGDFVSTEDGTGIVHIAPTFGADDYRVAKQAGIPGITVTDENGNEVPLVDKRGKFVAQVADATYGLGNEYVKEAYLSDDEKAAELKIQQERLKAIIAKLDKYISVDDRIALKLKLENRAFRVEKYEHSYPHCWRTDKPVLYYPLDSWFIRTTAAKDKLVALNQTINWKPASTGTGRFGNWLENLVDWNLSRSRYWGTPLPIWRTEDGSEEKCIGSIEELKSEMDKAIKAGVLKESPFPAGQTPDLHRPYVDRVILVSASGKPMHRETDLIDVWFDSGAMPYAQWNYPFSNKDIFEKSYPADFISEGVDQTRGWFFTLHAIAGLLFDQVAFKNVVSTGLVLDKNGEKMSKRKGNVINPFETIQKYGPDATRWYMISNAPPWDNLKFNLDGVGEVSRKFFGTLQNTYAFFALYANLDNFTFAEKSIALEKRTESDRWIISKLNSLIQLVDESYADYEPTKAARAIEDFVCEDLSNWYVRLNRKRFWKGEYNEDKIAAYQTLYTCLETVSLLASPIAPFYCEHLFRDLNSTSGKNNSESVHLAHYPKADAASINVDLEAKMQLAQEISSLIHSVRKTQNIRVRQPLAKAYVNVMDEKLSAKIADVENLIKDETNIKELVRFDRKSSGSLFTKSVLPDLKKLGKSLGQKINETKTILTTLTQDQIQELEFNKSIKLTFADGSTHDLSVDDVLIRTTDAGGMASASNGNVTVALDTTITEELKKEGIARDMVNRVQNLRKDMGLDVMDKIKIRVQKKSDLIDAAIQANKEYICRETQALSLQLEDQVSDAKTVDMDEFELLMKIEL